MQIIFLVPEGRAQALKDDLDRLGYVAEPVQRNDYGGPDDARRIGYTVSAMVGSLPTIRRVLEQYQAQEVMD